MINLCIIAVASTASSHDPPEDAGFRKKRPSLPLPLPPSQSPSSPLPSISDSPASPTPASSSSPANGSLVDSSSSVAPTSPPIKSGWSTGAVERGKVRMSILMKNSHQQTKSNSYQQLIQQPQQQVQQPQSSTQPQIQILDNQDQPQDDGDKTFDSTRYVGLQILLKTFTNFLFLQRRVSVPLNIVFELILRVIWYSY